MKVEVKPPFAVVRDMTAADVVEAVSGMNISEFLEELKALFEKYGIKSITPFCDCNDGYSHHIKILDDGTLSFMGMKIDTPAADVVEVRHGKWCLIEYDYFVCSRCGHWHYTGCESKAEAKERLLNGAVPNYCSNCGAKMDGKGEGE